MSELRRLGSLAFECGYYKGTLRSVLYNLEAMKEPKDWLDAIRYRRALEAARDTLERFDEDGVMKQALLTPEEMRGAGCSE